MFNGILQFFRSLFAEDESTLEVRIIEVLERRLASEGTIADRINKRYGTRYTGLQVRNKLMRMHLMEVPYKGEVWTEAWAPPNAGPRPHMRLNYIFHACIHVPSVTVAQK